MTSPTLDSGFERYIYTVWQKDENGKAYAYAWGTYHDEKLALKSAQLIKGLVTKAEIISDLTDVGRTT